MMYKLLSIILIIFITACDTNRRNDNEAGEMDTIHQEQSEAARSTDNVQVEFTCDSVSVENKYTLTLLMEQFNQSIPIDTVQNCQPLDVSQNGQYDTPDKINGLAEAGDFIYYSYVEKNQLVIMRSPKGSGAMNYQVHMSVPLEPVVNEPANGN